jgi:hypothetical protein
VKSRATKRFWKAYAALTEGEKDRAREAYRQFSQNPSHPSLQLKRVHPQKPIYSVRISLGYRAVGVLQGEVMTWLWIGGHDDYDRLLSKQ